MNRAEMAAVDGASCDLRDARGRLVVTPNALTLDSQRNVPADLRPGESLAVFLERHVPGIASGAWTVSIGGATVPKAMWSRTFPKHGQLIACRALVARQAVQLVAMAALAYFSMGMATGIYGALGGTFVSAAAGTYIGAIQVGVLMAGSMLINKVLGPKVPKMGDAAAARAVHSLGSQSNRDRKYEPLPTLWGEMRVTPDLAGKSYGWFDGDNQYMSTVLLGGINVHSAADLSVGDTPLSSFEEVSVFYNGFSGMASEEIPLYGNVDAIAGADLENDGTWVTRTSSTDTIALQVDIEGQLYDIDNKGNTLINSVPLFIETRPVGAGDWQPAHSVTLTNATLDVVRRTYTVALAQGQHEVRARLGKPTYDEGSGKDACKFVWSALKSIQPDTADYSGLGRIGIKIKATGQLSGSLDTLRATYRARPLPVWNGTDWITATTREQGLSNPGAILLQTLRGVYALDRNGVRQLQFGFGMSDDQIDIEGLKAFMLHCAARGYTYDRWVTSSMSLGQFCEEVALAGMGEFSWTDGSRPTAVFVSSGQPLSGVVNMANMLKGSFSVAYNLANAADGIEYQYLDRDRNWETQTLRVAAPGVTTMLNPAQLTGEGVTTEAHAAVLARYHLAQSLYQYKTVDFGADIEHLAYRRLSVLSISHDLTQWGFGGRVMAAGLNAAGKVVLQLDEPVPPMAQAYVGLRVPGARDYRVFRVEALEAESEWITLVEPWPEGVSFPGEPQDGEDNPAHDTLWCYDFKATPGYRVRVVGMQPEADLKGAQVTCVPEGPEFWDYVLNGTYTPAPNQSSLPQLGRPTVSNLRITEKVNVQGDTEWYSLSLVWDVEGDYDHAQVWAGRDGSELRMVDGNAVGSRSEFRIDGAGEWLVEVRPFNASGLVGQSDAVLYITSMTQLPPRNVDDFVVQEVAGGLRRFAWQYTGDRPPAFAGVQIRYLPGDVVLSVTDWDSMQPLGAAADIYGAQFETTRPQAGLWTFGCRAIDTAGQLANGVVRFVASLSDSFEQVQQPDMTPPPDVTGLKVSGMFTAVMVEWDAPVYSEGHGHARTIIYAAPGAGAALADALPVAEAFAGPVSFASAANASWTVWARNQSVDGVLSVNAVGGLTVRTSEDVDDVMEAVTGKVSEDHLVQHLGERIDLIDGAGPGSVNARLLAEAAETVALLSQEADMRAREVEAEQQARVAADLLEAQTRASALAQQTQELGNAVSSLTKQIQDGDTSISQRLDTVTATNYSRPNMLPGFEAWTLAPTFSIVEGAWGQALYTFEGGTAVAVSPQVSAVAGVGYVLTFDSLRYADAGSMYMDLEFFDASYAYLGETGQVMRFDRHDFREDDQNRLTNTFHAVAPAGTAWVRARAVIEGASGVTAVGWRQPKLERGNLPATRFTNEAQVELATAMVRKEEAARIDAVSAEARQRNDLAVQMRGNATGSDLGSITSGLLAQERNARISADNSLAYQMSMLSAGVGEQFDSAKIWYFDSDGNAEGWAGRGALTVSGGFMRLPDSTGWANAVSPAGLDVDANTYRQIKMRIRRHGAPVWVGVLMWRNDAGGAFDGTRSATVPEPSYDANGIAMVTWEPDWTGNVYQLNFDVYREQQPGGWFEIDWVAIGRPSPGASVALVVEEQAARAAADSAEADSRERLAVSLTGVGDPSGVPLGNLASGLLAEERNARVASDNAEVIARQNLAATVEQGLSSASAALQAEQKARADGDAAEASSRLALRAELYTRRNMCPDIFEWAHLGYMPDGFAVTEVADWGMAVFCGDGSKITAVGNVVGPAIHVQPGVTYTISGDTLLTAAAGFVCFDLIFKNAAGETVFDGPEKIRPVGHDFTADGSGRRLTEVEAVAPATAVTATPRFWWGNVVGGVHIGFRQVKVERGGLPSTPYTTETETQVLNANIVEESWARAQGDAAEAYARQQLEAAYNANNVELYARINAEQQARADADSAMAGQLQTLEARTQTRANLQFNGGFELGFSGWTGSINGWNVVDDAWGRSIGSHTLYGTGTLQGRPISALPGWRYSVACDTRLYAASGRVSVDMQFFDANGVLLLDGNNNARPATHDFSDSSAGRRLIEVSDIAPAGSAYFFVRLVWEDIQGLTYIGFRQVKVEVGGLPTTGYTAEGSLVGMVAKVESEAAASAERDSAASQRIDTLAASVITRPNLCPDVDKWTLQAPCYIERDGWGKSIRAVNPVNGTYVCSSPEIPCYAGQTYTITGDSLLYAAAGAVWLDLIFRDAAGNVVLDGPERPLSTYHDHSTTNANRDAHAVAAVAPPGAVKFIARFVAFEVVSCQNFGIRQIKVEQGGLPATIYTQEGEVAAVSAALQVEQSVRAEQTGALFGRYSVKIDLNGYMTGYGLLSESNNGVNTSTFAVRADRFVIGSASNNAVTPFYVEGNTTFMNMVVIRDGSIKNVMIQDATIESAKIVSLSVAKLVTGSLAVGQSIYSSGYSPGVSGWVLDGNGTGEVNNWTVRGTIYATAGSIGGLTIRNSCLTAGPYNIFNWPQSGTGMYIGPEGILLGNKLTGGYVELHAAGYVSMPGLEISQGNAVFSGELFAARGTFSGSLTTSAVNAVRTINIAGNAVTVPSAHTAAGYGATVAISLDVAAPVLVIATFFGQQISWFTPVVRRNGIEIFRGNGFSSGGVNPTVPITITGVDYPGAGVHTYTVGNVGDGASSSTTISVIGVKR